jgi:hypothetical protein
LIEQKYIKKFNQRILNAFFAKKMLSKLILQPQESKNKTVKGFEIYLFA